MFEMDAPSDPLRPPTLADLDALPSGVKGEILDGVLYTMTRPRARHQAVGSAVLSELRGPFQLGRGGPGGWWILPEPGIELPGSPEISPDLAGWRKDRLPELPSDRSIQVAPDWVCEVLSPTTRGYDLVTKRRFYAKHRIAWLWYVDPSDETLLVLRNDDGQWAERGIFAGDEIARAEPFDSIDLPMADLWPERT